MVVLPDLTIRMNPYHLSPREEEVSLAHIGAGRALLGKLEDYGKELRAAIAV
jgi:hypothetical protein